MPIFIVSIQGYSDNLEPLGKKTVLVLYITILILFIMATKNFEKMSSKSLEVLLNNPATSEEDQVAIQEVLDHRNAKQPTVVEVEPDDQETEDQETEDQETEDQETEEDKTKRAEKVAEMKTKVGCKVQIVPFNTATWVDGVITGVLDDRRARQPLWVVKTLENNKILRKAYGSDLIKISDEIVDIPKSGRTPGIKGVEFSAIEIAEQLAEATQNIGRYAEVIPSGETEPIKAVIVGAMHEKRANKVMYRLRKEDDAYIYKVFGPGVKVLEELDPETFAKAAEKREKVSLMTDPAKRIEYMEQELARLKNNLAQLQEKIAAKTQALEVAKKELDAANELE